MAKYDTHDLNAVLARLESGQNEIFGKLDEVAVNQKERWEAMRRWVEKEDKANEKRDRRIVKLENWRWYILGLAAGVAAAVKFIFGK